MLSPTQIMQYQKESV
ncbi:protein NinF, partial [Salmonella enterica]